MAKIGTYNFVDTGFCKNLRLSKEGGFIAVTDKGTFWLSDEHKDRPKLDCVCYVENYAKREINGFACEQRIIVAIARAVEKYKYEIPVGFIQLPTFEEANKYIAEHHIPQSGTIGNGQNWGWIDGATGKAIEEPSWFA